MTNNKQLADRLELVIKDNIKYLGPTAPEFTGDIIMYLHDINSELYKHVLDSGRKYGDKKRSYDKISTRMDDVCCYRNIIRQNYDNIKKIDDDISFLNKRIKDSLTTSNTTNSATSNTTNSATSNNTNSVIVTDSIDAIVITTTTTINAK